MSNSTERVLRAIDDGLEAVQNVTLEHALGNAVMKGLLTAQDAYDVLEYYEKTPSLEPEFDDAA